MATYKIENQYGELLGTESSVKKSYNLVEQYFQSSISISVEAARKSISDLDASWLPCVMDETIICTIKKV